MASSRSRVAVVLALLALGATACHRVRGADGAFRVAPLGPAVAAAPAVAPASRAALPPSVAPGALPTVPTAPPPVVRAPSYRARYFQISDG